MSSSNLHDILDLSNDVLSLHNRNSLKECTAKLDMIREKLADADRGKLDLKVIWNICGIIKDEITKLTEECTPPVNSLELCTQALFCLRNMFVNCSEIQLMVANTDALRDVLLACLKWVFLSRHVKGNNKENLQDGEKLRVSELRGKISQLAKASTTCLGNLVAANSATRRIIWPYLLPMLHSLLTYSEANISSLSCMVIYNCLLEQELREEFCSCDDVDGVICDLSGLYLNAESCNEKAQCFVLYTLEVLLCSNGRIGSVWSKLSGNQQVLVLDILSNILEGKSGSKCGSLSSSTVIFLMNIFKSEADRVLQTLTRNMADDSALIVARLLSFLCVAASESWGPTLKDDRSLLITIVSLLQCMKDIGEAEGNTFSRMGIDELSDEDKLLKAESHPAYGFKRDLIRLIASLVYRHKDNQDQIRDMGGLTLILENSQFDARNPGIKEVSIYAIRNLLEGNMENQQVVKDLQYRGSAENQCMQLSHMNGMVVVQSTEVPSPDKENL